MADIKFGFGRALKKLFRDMGNGVGAELQAVVILVHDTTRTHYFSVDSLPVSARVYDGNGRLTSETRGPDPDGLSFRIAYGYDANGRVTTESGWVKL